MGDPAGIGPEITAKATASQDIRGLAVFVVIGDKAVMQRAFSENAPRGGVRCVHAGIDEADGLALEEGRVYVLDPGGGDLAGITPGRPSPEGARKALLCIERAASLLELHDKDHPMAMVTSPVDKKEISGVRAGFAGHTEFLQEYFHAEMTTMLLAGDTLKVATVTRHIPIREVPRQLTRELLEKTIAQVIDNRAMISGKDRPVIGVCALNPHAGEGGKIGTEEIDVITPVIGSLRGSYGYIKGPLPADVAFYQALKGEIDIVISMYHDQGLGPFKMMDFDNGVNMTLGLGHVRTSPDHGTAFDIAARRVASSRSMENAIRLAVNALTAGASGLK